jgi:WD40 repeat protein
MLDPITILTTVGYAIARNAGSTAGGPNPVSDVFAQVFGGAAGNALYGDVQSLRKAFLTVTRPDSNRDLERASARSALHADLFCLMEALGEPLEPPSGQLEKWWLCVRDRLPQAMKDLRRPYGGFLSEAHRIQLLEAKTDCIDQLKKIEVSFKPNEIKPNQMLAAMRIGYAEKCAADALTGIESKHGQLPSEVHTVFIQKWFGYLCGSFHHEIKENQPVANILLNISIAELDRKVAQGFATMDQRFDETQALIRQIIKPPLRPLNAYATVPPPPDPFIARPEITEPIIENLLDGSETVGLTAIDGMGGVGKTVLALSLCYDRRVRDAFPDGIVWLPIGAQASVSLEKRVERVAIALNQEFREYSEATYRTLLSDRAILVVLDDVWTVDDIEPLRVGYGRSRLLYTSRDKGLAGALHAKEYKIGVIDEIQSRHFLARWSDRDSTALPDPAATRILSECQGLALALAMIGAALKGEADEEWTRVLADLQKAQLKDLGIKPHGYGYRTLYASIAVSVNALPTSAKSRYLQLAILLEDMPGSEELLRALWGVEQREVERTMRLFVDRSLASRDSSGDIRLHDFQLDYIRGEHQDPGALALIQSAVKLTADTLETLPSQFTPQLIGRLLPYMDKPGIERFIAGLATASYRPWLRPLKQALSIPGASLVRRLPANRIGSVIGNSDGSRAVAANSDGTIVLWDLNMGRKLFAFGEVSTGDFGPHVRACVSADFRRAVFYRERDGVLRVCNLETRKELKPLPVNPDGFRDFVISPDGKFVISGGQDFTIWDLDAGEKFVSVDGVSVSGLQANSNWKRLLINAGKFVEILDMEHWQPICRFQADLGYRGRITMSADARRAVSHDGYSGYCVLKVWDLETGKELHKCEMADDWEFSSITINADGTRAISASRSKAGSDGLLRIWDLEKGQEICSIVAHSNTISKVVISSDGKRAVSASYDRTLKLWDLEAREELQKLVGHSSYILNFDWNEELNTVLSTSTDSTLAVWTLGTGQLSAASVDHTINVSGVASSTNGHRVVSGAGFWEFDVGELKVWDGATGTLLRTIKCHPVAKVAITADGRLAISASFDYTLKVWDLDSGRCDGTLAGHRDQVEDVGVSADGSQVISVSADGTLRVWDTKRSREIYALKYRKEEDEEDDHSDSSTETTRGAVIVRPGTEEDEQAEEVRAPSCVALSANGKRAVVGFSDGTLDYMDLRTRSVIYTLVGHKDGVNAVELTADGKRAISASDDTTLKLWDLETGREIRTMAGRSDGYYGDVAVSPSGKRAASASDNNLRMWDLDQGELVCEFLCDGEVTSCAFLDEGRLVAGDAGGRVHFFQLEEPQRKVH